MVKDFLENHGVYEQPFDQLLLRDHFINCKFIFDIIYEKESEKNKQKQQQKNQTSFAVNDKRCKSYLNT